MTVTTEATTSVISTAMKFDVTNCAIAKESPATTATGQV